MRTLTAQIFFKEKSINPKAGRGIEGNPMQDARHYLDVLYGCLIRVSGSGSKIV
jgi:hypothetical protein